MQLVLNVMILMVMVGQMELVVVLLVNTAHLIILVSLTIVLLQVSILILNHVPHLQLRQVVIRQTERLLLLCLVHTLELELVIHQGLNMETIALLEHVAVGLVLVLRPYQPQIRLHVARVCRIVLEQ